MILRQPLVMILFIILVVAASLGFTLSAQAATTTLYYYSAENCPHCKIIGPQIHALAERYDDVVLVEKDIWQDRSAFREMLALVESHGDLPVATPALFLGDSVWIGIDENGLRDLEQQIQKCLAQRCRDALQRLSDAATRTTSTGPAPPEDNRINLPLLGEREVSEISLPVVTIILGLLDSINPCAFFVLLFLLTLMIHAHSRPRMLTVGVVFVVFSGLIYFLFMAAWLNLFLATGGLRAVTLVAGLIALLIGVLNIKDYFLFHRGPSLSIPDKVKPGLYQRTRNLVKSSSYLSLLGGTVLLAIAANSYELLCTAGFPMVFTRILTLQQLPTWQYYTYLAAYNLIYILPLLIIVVIFAVTLGAHQLSERQGRFLKLLAGVMMFTMGIVLIFLPAVLQNLAGTIALFAVAMTCVGLIVGLDRMLRREKGGD